MAKNIAFPPFNRYATKIKGRAKNDFQKGSGKMTTFETACKRLGENFLWDMLENWERHYLIRHSCMMSLEERWAFFIRATDSSTVIAA